MKKAEILKILGDETRLRLLNLLIFAERELCVCEMVDALKMPQYKVSRHLALLRHADLLTAHHQGTWMYYSINRRHSQNAALFAFLRSYLIGNPYQADCQNLAERLKLRDHGKCVVGYTAKSRKASKRSCHENGRIRWQGSP